MKLLTVSHGVFTAFFVLAAYVQLNDPDAAFWIALYMFAAGMSLLGCFDKLPRFLPILYAASILIYAFVYMPSFPKQVDVHFFEQEEVREKGGLCLIAFQMLLLTLGATAQSSLSLKGISSSLSALYISAIAIALLSALGAYYLPQYLASHNLPVADHCKGTLA